MPHKKMKDAVAALKRPVTFKQAWPAWLFAFLLLAVTLYNFLSLMSFRAEVRRLQLESLPKAGEAPAASASSSTMSVDGTAMSLVSPIEEAAGTEQPLPQVQMSSFGDNFSGLAYIDGAKTDMYWDENVTAFSFPPLFELEKKNDCSQPGCGLAPASDATETVCLSSGCLNWTDNKLYYKGKTLKYPPDLPTENILDVSIKGMGNFFLIGIVTGPEEEERGWVYRFDGLSYVPVITSGSDYRIEPRFQRGGGKISFGGTAEDYLILYSGYDGRVYRVREGKIDDLSRFFGLRVTAGGFEAQVFSRKGVFYVCSLTESKAKVIKVWQDKEGKAAGALDLSLPMAAQGWRPDSIRCAVNPAGGLVIAANTGGAWGLWNFRDKGFDNAQDRTVQSGNLIRQKEIRLEAAVVADLGLEAQFGYELFLGNDPSTMSLSAPYVWQTFPAEGSGLYWQLKFKGDKDTSYSPWLDHINRLDYLFTE